jgi:hypothetical protein
MLSKTNRILDEQFWTFRLECKDVEHQTKMSKTEKQFIFDRVFSCKLKHVYPMQSHRLLSGGFWFYLCIC